MLGEAKLFRCIKAGKVVRFVPSWSNPIEIIEHWARIKPAKAALTGLIDHKHWITRSYCQLVRRILAAAKNISDQPNERLAIVCGSHVSTVEVILAAIATGRQFVPIDLLRKPLTTQLFKLSDSKAKVIVIPALEEMPELLVDRINEVKAAFNDIKIWSLGENKLAEVNLLAPVAAGTNMAQPDFLSCSWNDPTAMLYSPGRHGQPKGYVYQTSSLCANIYGVMSWLKLNEKSRLLLAAELECCDGLIPVLAAIFAGGTAILHSQIDSGNFWKIIPECDADLVRATPWLIEELLADNSKQTHINRSNLKFIITGSAYLPRQIGLRFFETFDLPLLQSYGTAETGGYILGMSPGLSWHDYELALRDNIAGQELPYCNVTVKPPEILATDTKPANAEEGVLHVRGHVLSCGYWDGNEIQYWKDPWLKTSDMAVNSSLQDQPYFQIRGRIEDTFVIDSQRIWPAYIERSLLDTFQFLRDCVVMATPDRTGKQKLCAVMILSADIPTHRRNELLAQIEARLQANGVSGLTQNIIPREIMVLDDQHVPRRYDGHPDREQLHSLVEHQDMRQGMIA